MLSTTVRMIIAVSVMVGLFLICCWLFQRCRKRQIASGSKDGDKAPDENNSTALNTIHSMNSGKGGKGGRGGKGRSHE